MTKELQKQAINQEYTISLWTERICACQNKNLNVAQWCSENERASKHIHRCRPFIQNLYAFSDKYFITRKLHTMVIGVMIHLHNTLRYSPIMII